MNAIQESRCMVLNLYCKALCLLVLSIFPGTLWAANADGPNNALGPALEGEFALQGGDYSRAAERYLQAARLTKDPALAQRATEIALVTHQDALAARALRRWRDLSPHSADTASASAVLALRRGDRRQARDALLAMLADGSEGWKNAIRSLAAAGDTPTATAVAGDLFEQGRWPQRIDAWLAFGALAESLDDARLAQRIATEVIKRFPQEPSAWLLESARLREEGDTAGSRRAIERAMVMAHGDAGMRGVAASCRCVCEIAGTRQRRGQGSTQPWVFDDGNHRVQRGTQRLQRIFHIHRRTTPD